MRERKRNSDIADLEISIHRWDDDSYRVEIRYHDPVNKVDIGPAHDEVEFDFTRLLEHIQNNDMVAYGQLLTDTLFSPPIQSLFERARANLEGNNLNLRLRLYIGPSAPRLNSLRWETLRDPQSGTWLLTSETILFSRYLSSQDFRPVLLRPESALKALIVIANPSNLGSNKEGGYPNLYRLQPHEVAEEVVRALGSFGSMPTLFLGDIPVEQVGAVPTAAAIVNERATLNNIIKRLREGYDILYLVCHGAILKKGPQLWLEKEDGTADVVAGNEMVARLGDLEERPRLVVLASCQSAGAGSDEPPEESARNSDGAALAALGPRLARAGIPAVIAMQGNVSIATVSEFMGTLFQELRRDGQIDHAMAVARDAIRKEDDSWMPVLFLRISDGRIWYVPGFAKDDGFRKWNSLIDAIDQGRCTPILGSGLIEPLVGSTRDIARNWARIHHFPMAPHNQDDLPQVAQYLTVDQAEFFMRSQLRKELSNEVIRRFGARMEYDSENPPPLEDLMSMAGAILYEQNPVEPHKILASLPFPLYITTNSDGLTVQALERVRVGPRRDIKKNPRWECYRWTPDRDIKWPTPLKTKESDYIPSKENPLVYHLFGHLEIEDSVVLSEDNYFDYLLGVTQKDNRMPGVVRRALASNALLFLGFNLDDWNFRVLFRGIMGLQGDFLRKKYVHVAVQINPEEGRLLDPENARKYLQERFEGVDISIFWGNVDFFVRELKKEWNNRHPPGSQI